ncbi:MAG: hypothetical protein AAGE52_19160 [Myxococcota bacterium]
MVILLVQAGRVGAACPERSALETPLRVEGVDPATVRIDCREDTVRVHVRRGGMQRSRTLANASDREGLPRLISLVASELSRDLREVPSSPEPPAWRVGVGAEANLAVPAVVGSYGATTWVHWGVRSFRLQIAGGVRVGRFRGEASVVRGIHAVGSLAGGVALGPTVLSLGYAAGVSRFVPLSVDNGFVGRRRTAGWSGPLLRGVVFVALSRTLLWVSLEVMALVRPVNVRVDTTQARYRFQGGLSFGISFGV